jgi:AcrR family transcriptional regulator
VDVAAGDPEVAGAGLDEADRRAGVLDLTRVRRSGDQDREPSTRTGADDVGEQADAVAHRHRDVVVLSHRVIRDREVAVVAAAGLGAVEPALTGIDTGDLGCHDGSLSDQATGESQRMARLDSWYDETSFNATRDFGNVTNQSGAAKDSTAARVTPGPRDERGVLAARILAEARASFAEQGYAGTTVRAVARAADVDPALVYHYYHSKERLLDAATTPPQSFLDQIVTAWQTPPADLGEQLVRQMLRNWQDPEHEPVLRAVLQIAGNEPATREKLRHLIERSMMGPSAQALSASERLLRSSLIASQLMGLAFMRFIWKIEPLASMADEEVVAVIAPTVQRYLDGDLG